MIQLPEQLQSSAFRFIKTKPFNKKVWKHCTDQLKRDDLSEKQRVEMYQKLIRPKTPAETGHKIDKNYAYNDPEFQQYLKIATGYAVLTGVGDLVVVESDSKEISDFMEQHYPNTFTVCSRKNQPYRKHFYIIIHGMDAAIPLGDNEQGDHLGEIQCGKALVTGPNSIHAVTGEPYTVVNDAPILTVDKKDFFEVFKPYIQQRLQTEYTEDYYADFPTYNISISDVVDFNTLKEQSEGRWQGSHPVHGSSTGRNFAVFPEKNYWRCFRHGTYGGVFSLIAMQHGIINCEDVQHGCLKGRKWEEVLQVAREQYGLEITSVSQHATDNNHDGDDAERISLGSHAYLLYEKNGDIAKVTRLRKSEKLEYVYRGHFQPMQQLILDGQPFFKVDLGDGFIGNVNDIVNQMKARGGVISNREITDAVNAVLAHADIEKIVGHSTYGVYLKDDELYYCTNPFPKSDEQKLICNEMQQALMQPITKKELKRYADILKYWDDYEVLPAMSYGIMASFAFVLRQKGIMFQFLWHDSLESDLGKTTVGLIFSLHLWCIPDSSGDSLASAFRVSDTLDSVGGLRVINEAEKIPWKSSVGQILKQAAERSMANKRGKSSGGSEYYFSRAGFIVTSNGFPITSGNDLIRIFKVEFNVDRKRERQQNRQASQQLSKKLRKLKPIGYQLVLHELDDINHSFTELIKRCETYGDEIVDCVSVPIKSNRRVTGYGIIYEGLKAWERVFQQHGIDWKAPSIKEYTKNVVEKIEQFTFESKIPPITEFLFWFENYKDTPTGEIKFQQTWDEKEIDIVGNNVAGFVICYPILTEYKRQTKDHSLNNLADIARSISSISGYPIEQIYHPRRFLINEKTKKGVFLPSSVFEDGEDETSHEINISEYSFLIHRYEEIIGDHHLSKKQLKQRRGIIDDAHFEKDLQLIHAAINDKSFHTTIRIDENSDYYNNTKNKVSSQTKKSYNVSHPQKRGNLVIKGDSTGEKNRYHKGNSEHMHGNGFQQKKKTSDYHITTISERDSSYEHTSQNYVCIQSMDQLNKIIETITKNNIQTISIDTETTSLDVHTATLVGISFSYTPHEAYYIPIAHSKQIDYQNLPKKQVLTIFKEKILENPSLNKIGQNIKYDYQIFQQLGITINSISFDTMLASYVLNPSNKKSLDVLAKRHCNYNMQPISELIGKGKKKITFDKVPIEKASFYACEDADYTLQVYQKLKPLLDTDENKELKQIFYELELPLIPVIAAMENTGVTIDEKQIKKVSQQIQDEIQQLEKSIYKEAGETFNINSTADLQRILYDKHQYDIVKYTPKQQPSTDTEALELLSQKHKLPQLLLRYRELNKLYTTYLSAYPRFINKKSGRIHASFNQAGAVSGRFSSSNPNLQNIPAVLRKTFIPRDKEHVFVAADYSQMELRILADFSRDQQLIDAFTSGQDVHTLTASHVFSVPYNKVTKEQRSIAKTVNFGIIYGMSAYGLAARTNLCKTDAKTFIETYFKYYADVKRFISKIRGYALKHGYVFTKFNRRIHLKKVFSKDKKIKEEGLRQAQNIPIQGTGADIIKMVMLGLHQRLQDFDAALVLTVHDELVFEVHVEHVDAVKKIIAEEMEHAVELCVPLMVDIGVGGTWYDAKH